VVEVRERAFIRVRERNYRGAIADYDRAIECDKKYAAAYNNRGYAHVAMGDHEGAPSDPDEGAVVVGACEAGVEF
jgi:tetratricopeptide (TPR) repeat protein